MLVVGCLLVLVLAGVSAGCSSGETDGTRPRTAPASAPTTVGPTTTVAQTTTTLPQALTDWDRELAETAQVQNQLAAYLTEQGAARTTPGWRSSTGCGPAPRRSPAARPWTRATWSWPTRP